jgi:hypothetical protein
VGEGWKRKVNGINQGRTYDQSSRSYSIFLPSSPQQLCTSPPFPLSLLSPNISQPLNYLQEVMYPSPLQIPLSISPSYASIIIPTPNSKKVKSCIIIYHHQFHHKPAFDFLLSFFSLDFLRVPSAVSSSKFKPIQFLA